jgi:hypothetical protein
MLSDIDHQLAQNSGQSPHRSHLSKSKFIASVQCLRRLYLQINPPEAAIVVLCESERLDQGRYVGELAQTAFPGGSCIGDSDSGLEHALLRTAALIDDPSVPAIFEAAFRFEGITVRVDILQRQPGNQWRLIEVKSSTGCKEHHLWDVAVQKYVLSGCGLLVSGRLDKHPCKDCQLDLAAPKSIATANLHCRRKARG